MKTPIILSLMAFLLAVINPLWGQITPIGFKAFQKGDSLYLHIINDSDKDTLSFPSNFVIHNFPCSNPCPLSDISLSVPHLNIYKMDSITGKTPIHNSENTKDCFRQFLETSDKDKHYVYPKQTCEIIIPMSIVLQDKEEISNVLIDFDSDFLWQVPAYGIIIGYYRKSIRAYLYQRLDKLQRIR